jgi:hypothetical protein
MPKKEVDYSNTIIYKIYCKDKNITDVYVGHTTNFIQRKYSHKIACNNLTNDLKIYNVIRCNGGWDNWDMVEIAKYNCKDSTEARIKEQQHYDILKSSLNSCPPYVDIKQYFCSDCNLQCMTPKQYENHMNCNKHIKKINKLEVLSDNEETNELTESCSKVAPRFSCELCDYITDKKSSFDKHLMTSKHIKLTNVNCFNIESCQKVADNIKEFICNCCNKNFKSRVGLWKHKQKCKSNNIDINKNLSELDKDELIITLLKQNAELIKGQQDMMISQQDMMIKLTENGINNHSNNTTTNSHNKAFNLNFFLNETCKNAMNITDFVDSIKLQLSDLMEVGELGYVDGISKIIVKNLNSLDETVRPIHCTDKKRETMYVKDHGEWEKEDEKKSKITKAVKTIANKNIRLLPQFREKYPDYKNSHSTVSDKYEKMVIEAMTSDQCKDEKIIKNISKEVIIDKNT